MDFGPFLPNPSSLLNAACYERQLVSLILEQLCCFKLTYIRVSRVQEFLGTFNIESPPLRWTSPGYIGALLWARGLE